MLEKITRMLTKLTRGKNNARNKGDKNLLSFDLLYQLSYMTAIAAGGAPRSEIFARSARLPCVSAEYFRKVELVSKQLKYDYARACRVVGDSTKEEMVKSLLLRFSSSLISGEPEAEFLAREAQMRAESFDNEYSRELEALKMWTDAYISLTLSVVLVIIIGIVSTMIYTINTVFMIAMPVIGVGATAIGIWLIYSMSPKEVVVLPWVGSKEQQFTRTLFKVLVPAALVISVFTLLIGLNLGLVMLAVSALLFPIGVVMWLDNRKISKRDAEIGVFLGSLGSVAAALGTTVSAALARLDLGAINSLRSAAQRLHTRLSFGIKPRICWRKFIDETGSELVNRSVSLFYDTIDLGGAAGQAGHQASFFATKVALLRAKRQTISSPFRSLCIAMHGAVIMLLVFITEVITAFAGMVAKAEEIMPSASGQRTVSLSTSFNTSGLQMVNSLVLPLILVFTIANAIAPNITEGGSRYKIFYNLGITGAISGASLVFLPKMAQMLFNSAPM